MNDPNAMNEAVKKRLAHLIFSLCEAEVFLSNREAVIAELEEENNNLRAKLAELGGDEIPAMQILGDTQ